MQKLQNNFGIDGNLPGKHPLSLNQDIKHVDDGGPLPLTAYQRRLLRRKSYSFPFLCEKSWNNCDDDDDDEEDMGGGIRREELIAEEVTEDDSKADLG